MMNIRHLLFILSGVVFFSTFLRSQDEAYPIEVRSYPFIQYPNNRFILSHDSTQFRDLYSKFDSLILYGQGQLSIVHLGGSHIQADIYTHRMRQRFNNLQPGLINGRGFIFPYRVAGTNNPKNYRVEYSGEWTTCKSTHNHPECHLGLSGISVSTTDTSSKIKIFLNRDTSLHFEFNRLKIFHPDDLKELNVLVSHPENVVKKLRASQMGYTLYEFNQYYDSIELKFVRTDSQQVKFDLYGLSFESDDQGIIYNSIGVNGAKLESYLNCELFENHLSALKPDLVIVSIGTNDGYTRRFDKRQYLLNYRQLLAKITRAAPNSAILLTVPNDSYLFRRYINRNTAEMEEVILELSERYGLAVWDFYEIMGGLNSVKAWYDAGLMNADRVHFSKEGYVLKGDLLFAAFLNTWNEFLR